MKLNLREIIEIPGGSVPFAQELDTALLDFPSVRAYTAPITAEPPPPARRRLDQSISLPRGPTRA